MRVYYAHSMALYGTPQEARDELLLEALGLDVLNPNTPASQAGAKKDGMNYFRPLVEQCGVLAFRALPDGAIGSGVAIEIGWAQAAGLVIIELPSAISRRTLTLAQTREYLVEIGER